MHFIILLYKINPFLIFKKLLFKVEIDDANSPVAGTWYDFHFVVTVYWGIGHKLNYGLSVSLMSTYKQKAELCRNYHEVLGQHMNS